MPRSGPPFAKTAKDGAPTFLSPHRTSILILRLPRNFRRIGRLSSLRRSRWRRWRRHSLANLDAAVLEIQYHVRPAAIYRSCGGCAIVAVINLQLRGVSLDFSVARLRVHLETRLLGDKNPDVA